MASCRSTLLVLGAGIAFATTCYADDCQRSTPAPLFTSTGKGVEPLTFSLVSRHEAREQFRLAPDVHVKVEHAGCVDIVVRLRFESPDLFAQGYSDALAYAAAVSLLRRLQDARPTLSLDLGLAGAALAREASRNHVLGKEWVFLGSPGEILLATVQLHAAGRSGASGYIDLTVAQGPL